MALTAEQKRDCALREVRMRQRVYPRWVEACRMTSTKADEEISTMIAIAADYDELAKKERLL